MPESIMRGNIMSRWAADAAVVGCSLVVERGRGQAYATGDDWEERGEESPIDDLLLPI